MTPAGDVYVGVPVHRVGEAVPVTAASLAATPAEAEGLRSEGFTSFRRADVPGWRLAAAATRPVLARLASAGLEPGRFLYATEKVFGEHSATVLARYLLAVGRPEAACLMVGGYSCADFVAGLEIAGRLGVGGGDGPVVLVTADVLADGASRAYRGLAVVSDAAAACALTSVPVGPGFRLLATALRSSARIDGTGSSLVDLRASGRQIRSVADTALAEADVRRDEVRHVVVDNLRPGARHFVGMAAGFRDLTVVVSADPSYGHCHAADPAIALARLHEQRRLDEGDHVLVVATSGRAWTAAALRYGDGARG